MENLELIFNQSKAPVLFGDIQDVGKLKMVPKISIERMTDDFLSNHERNIPISYSFEATLFGKTLIASTETGICFLAFNDDEGYAMAELKENFPNAACKLNPNPMFQHALSLFKKERVNNKIVLHVKGSDFQLKVWRALLKITFGTTSSYGEIAKLINMPNASRAVGTATGSNIIGYLIPCHRVVRACGTIGHYRWGNERKIAMLQWEKQMKNS